MNITAGKFKGRKIVAPEEKITRPTLSKTRMSIFNSLYSILGDFQGLSFLDTFGGSGIMGLEALSRGFKKTTVFEINKKSAEIIKKNYAALDLKPDLIIGDSLKLIKKMDEIYDVVFIDPPYQSGVYEKILSNINGRIIIVEHSEDVDFSEFIIIKQKSFGSTKITFLESKNCKIS